MSTQRKENPNFRFIPVVAKKKRKAKLIYVGNFKKARVILNPAANHGQTGKLIDKINKLLKPHFEFELLITSYPRQGENFATKANGSDLIIGIGGDGTINEIVNGMMTLDNPIPLAFLPTGSGNDLQRMLGISKNLETAIEQIANGKIILIDIIKANNRYYANSLGIGFDAQVAHLANQTKQKTKKSGLLLYLQSLFKVLLKDYCSYKIKLKVDVEDWQELDVTLLAANSGQSYGGGFLITPQAQNDDGLIDLCYVDALPRYEVILRLPFVIFGRHTWMKPFHMFKAKKVWVKSADGKPIPAHLDGEILLAKEFKIEVLPKKFPVVVPSNFQVEKNGKDSINL